MNLQENINRVRQIMGLTTEGRNKIFSLDYVKNKIADATSWKDFKEKNPYWGNMYNFIINDYGKDTWQDLISVFDDTPMKSKRSLDLVKNKIADATSWKDFKEKNPNWFNIYQFVNNNYGKDTWQDLTSHFDDIQIKSKRSLDIVKNKIADATSWKDFKQKNPNWVNMYNFIIDNYDKDTWQDLISHFDDTPMKSKRSLENIKVRIADTTSWEDFKEKNPNWISIYQFVNNNYGKDTWETLTSHFDDKTIYTKHSLDIVKNKIADATSWKDFKQKNPKWFGLYHFVNKKYGKNTWQDLISVFDDAPMKYSLDQIKRQIADATSWKDFKEKNPNWVNMYQFVINNYDKDTWQDLISVFDNDKKTKRPLDLIKNKIEDATSWEDFKQKNPKWAGMYQFVKNNYGKDTWQDLISVFDDAPMKYSLEHIKERIADATSWKDFKEKNPNWVSIYQFVKNNYGKDTWQDLISVFDNDKKTKRPLDYIKVRIADATSLKDFKEKNPKWRSMQQIMNDKYKDDPENNWKKLTSHFVK